MTADSIKLANLDHLASEVAEPYRACEGVLVAGLQVLADQPAETVVATLDVLWHAAAGRPLSVQCASQVVLSVLDAGGVFILRTLLRRCLEGAPLAYLTGRQLFMGVELIAAVEALIPREETELLGRAALEQMHAIVCERGDGTVIDVCTGLGNLALTLAWHEPRARVWGGDLSEDAVAPARWNVAHIKQTDRVSFRTGDLLAPFDKPEIHGHVDLLVCNPPYISSGKVDAMSRGIIGYEPRLAFDGGPFGIRILQRLINEAPRFLRAGGWLAVEDGLGQGQGICHRLEQHDSYFVVNEILDQNSQLRALLARKSLATGMSSPQVVLS